MNVVVVGSANLDVSARISRLPRPGETVTGATIEKFPGGKGANQAFAARQLGANVKFIACVGNDSEADQALTLLRQAGVDIGQCTVDEEAGTGLALITVDDAGENSIVVAPGANTRLIPDRVRLPEADALICQLEIPAATVAHCVAQFPGFTCANLAPARDIDASVFAACDLIVVNETEAQFFQQRLMGYDGLLAKTLGADGAELWQSGSLLAKSPSLVVDVVDTTGAGDTFTAALTIALCGGQDHGRALNFACTAAALATTKRGAQPSMPSMKDVDGVLNASR